MIIDCVRRLSCSGDHMEIDKNLLWANLNSVSTILFEENDIVEVRAIHNIRKGDITHRWTVAKDLSTLADNLVALNLKGYNLYFGVNPRKHVGGTKKEDVVLARCLFADFDDKDDPLIRPGDGCGRYEFVLNRIIDAELPEPSLVVSSGGGIHTYWRMDESITDAHAFKTAQKQIIHLLHSDNSVNDFPRIMRLPGFLNVKTKPYRESFIIYPTGRI